MKALSQPVNGVSFSAGTYCRQKELPKLPLPDLGATCDKYLRTVKPLVSKAAFETTKAAVSNFLQKDGPVFHKALEKYHGEVDNYVEEFWDAAYLEYTVPTVLNVNPIFVLEDDPTPSRNSQIARASSLILSSIKFIRNVRSETLTVDEVRGRPLCMSQFKSLFGSARLPVFEENKYVRDKIVTCEDSRHIVVMSCGQMYYFDVVWADGTPAITQREISKNLEAIIKDSHCREGAERISEAVGVLTAEDRKTWAQQRRQLESLSRSNRRTLHMIDTALFVLCLDQADMNDMNDIAKNMLHGTYDVGANDGVQHGTCLNRWYDKLQLIVTGSGNAGVNFEHSAMDGHTVLRFASDVFTDTIVRFAQTISGHRVQSFIDHSGKSKAGGAEKSEAKVAVDALHKKDTETRRPETRPRKLELEMNDYLLSGILFAERRLSDMILQNETECLEFTGYGKLYIMQNSMSPDAFVQLSIMSAYYQMYGRLVNTYESVQTKSFLKGRTEAARSVTPEAAKFLGIWVNGTKNTPTQDKVDMLREALTAHSKMTREAANGLGCDRHLYAMQRLFQKQHPEEPLPEIFTDPSYAVLGSSILSTSNCGNPSLRFFGFGPVVNLGFGIGYIIKDDAIHYMITSKHRQTARFTSFLRKYLEEVQDCLIELAPMPTPCDSASLEHRRVLDGQYDFFGTNAVESPQDPPSPVGRALSGIKH